MAKKYSKNKELDEEEVEFDFIKSNFFRVIHADGVFGGLGPRGDIHMQIFNERRAIPTKTVHALESFGGLGPEIKPKRQGRAAVVREVEADIVIRVELAISMQKWLAEKIAEYQQLASDLELLAKKEPTK